MSSAIDLAARGRSDPYRMAYIGGTFDCLHRGHLALFAAARKIANQIVVSVNTDEFSSRYKRLPLMPFSDRLAVLNACRLVDRVIVNSGDEDSRPAILYSGADCVVHGSDWSEASLMRQMSITPEWLHEQGIDLVILPYSPWTSTSQLLDAYNARNI